MLVTTNNILHDHDDHGAYEGALHGFPRSSHFAVEEKKAREHNSSCVITGVSEGTEWHHAIIPFHIARIIGRWELEFSSRNLIFLLQKPGMEYHRVVGHLLFFQSYNPTLHADIKRFNRWSISRIMNDPLFLKSVHARPRSWRDMTEQEKNALIEYVDQALPVDKEEIRTFGKYKPKS